MNNGLKGDRNITLLSNVGNFILNQKTFFLLLLTADSTGWQYHYQNIGKKRSLRVKAKGRRKSLPNPDIFHRRLNKDLRRAALRYKHSNLQALKTSEREAFTNNLEYRLVKLNGKIAGMKLKLQQMRDRKKRLMRIRMQTSFQEYFEPFPCECVPAVKGKKTNAGKTRKKRQPKQETEARSYVFREGKNKKSRRGDGFKAQLEKMIKSRSDKKKGKKSRGRKCAKVGMTCYHHTENHWKTEPRWTRTYLFALPFVFYCLRVGNLLFYCCYFTNAFKNTTILLILQNFALPKYKERQGRKVFNPYRVNPVAFST